MEEFETKSEMNGSLVSESVEAYLWSPSALTATHIVSFVTATHVVSFFMMKEDIVILFVVKEFEENKIFL